MEKYILRGGQKLNGEITLQGAKNSVLPLLAATLLYAGETVLYNVPKIKDVEGTINILRYIGCRVRVEGNTVTVDASGASRTDIPDELMQEMRSSVLFVGALLARFGSARLTRPGGCEIGTRPIDIHLGCFEQLGYRYTNEGGKLTFSAQNPAGNTLDLSFPSVGATENAMIVAALLEGKTVIRNAAKEPEIVDLEKLLTKMGASVRGAGSGEIVVEGVRTLQAAVHTVLPDRIAAATYLSAVCATGGDVTIRHVRPADMYAILAPLRQMGAEIDLDEQTVRLQMRGRPRAVRPTKTMPHPGFPTDALPPLLAAACYARGTSIFTETIFENRYRCVSDLVRMGGNIVLSDRVAVVDGVRQLYGKEVIASDLRGGAALVVAALAAQDESKIGGVEHIERGYEEIEKAFNSLGADIRAV